MGHCNHHHLKWVFTRIFQLRKNMSIEHDSPNGSEYFPSTPFDIEFAVSAAHIIKVQSRSLYELLNIKIEVIRSFKLSVNWLFYALVKETPGNFNHINQILISSCNKQIKCASVDCCDEGHTLYDLHHFRLLTLQDLQQRIVYFFEQLFNFLSLLSSFSVNCYFYERFYCINHIITLFSLFFINAESDVLSILISITCDTLELALLTDFLLLSL